jgi:hypothetical protein
MDIIKYAAIIVITLVIIYELIFGYFVNVRQKACPSNCDSFNVHPIYDDKEEAAKLLETMDKKIFILLDRIKHDDSMRDEVRRIITNYDRNSVYEISPQNITGITSFLRQKRVLILCLRRKDNGDLHDENTITFVVLHELAHMMNEKWGHGREFWSYFKYLLENAVESGIYTPIDYKKRPVKYCGLDIVYSPLFSR